GMQDFQGDGAVVFQVLSHKDCGHAPTPELSLERISVLQGLSERLFGRGGWDKDTSSQGAVRLSAAGARDSAHRKRRMIAMISDNGARGLPRAGETTRAECRSDCWDARCGSGRRGRQRV